MYKVCFVLLAAILLSGCGAFGQATPQTLPTVVLDSEGTTPQASSPASGAGVIASGIVVPAQQARIAAAMGGNVETVTVTVGDQVQAGQVLLKLSGAEKLAAAVEAANLELLSAQQALASLNENAGQARAQAQLRLAQAKDAFDTAEKQRGWKQYRVGNDNQIAVAQADVIVAEEAVRQAEETYGYFVNRPENDLNKAAALSALSSARTARDKAKANLSYLLSLPDTIEVEKADAELEVARTELESAQREFDKRKDGPDPEALALVEARVQNAQAQLAASQAVLTDLELKAPFAGTIAELSIHSGEWVVPGQPVLLLADLSQLRIETTDLSERDISKIVIGRPVTVFIKALNQNVEGRVSAISPLADTLGGDVVYKTTIDLDAPAPGLREGMSVEVQFGVGE
jgi:multidrug efflux pump subunit AcrA (membrane-fusion protein)